LIGETLSVRAEIHTTARFAKLAFDSGLARVKQPADMVAFIRQHVYKSEYKKEAHRGSGERAA